MRGIATGLLVAMAVVFILARTMEVHYPGWGYLRAFAEAAMVGALADWFAVVALFRHPLGVPLPHTAIIPNNKDRIGESLGRFVTDNFLTTAALRPKLEKLDLVGITAGWLTEKSVAIADRVCGVIPAILKKLDDAAVRRFLHQQLVGQLRTIELAPLTGKLLEALTEGDKHRAILGEWWRIAVPRSEACAALPGYRGLTGLNKGCAVSAANARYGSFAVICNRRPSKAASSPQLPDWFRLGRSRRLDEN